MLLAILTGILVGLVLSLLAGPTFFSLLKISISNGFKSGVYFAVGVFLADLIYILLAVILDHLVGFSETYETTIYLVGGSFLFGIGLYYIFKKVDINIGQVKTLKNAAYFFKGFFMCLLNPMMLFYWITIETKFASEYNDHLVIGFLAGTSFTLLGSDIAKAYYVNKYRDLINTNHVLWLNRFAGTIIAGYAFFKLLLPVLKGYM